MRQLPSASNFALLLALCVVCGARSAHAEWKSVREVTLGTAQVLEQGSLTFGVITPLAYGINNRLTLQSHPVLNLLLVPNLTARMRLFEQGEVIVSATASARASLYQAGSRSVDVAAVKPLGTDGQPRALHEPGAPGLLDFGVVGTWYAAPQWALSATPMYALRTGTHAGVCETTSDCPGQHDCIENRCIGEDTSSQGVALGLETHWLPRPSDLLVLGTTLRWNLSASEADRPAVHLYWAHAFTTWANRAHLLVGLNFGRFEVRSVFGSTGGVLPLMPFVDLWWRL